MHAARIDALHQGDTMNPDELDLLSFGIEIVRASGSLGQAERYRWDNAET